MIKKFVEHNGLKLVSYNTEKYFDGVLTFLDNRLVLSGNVSFTFAKGSYKFPEQFIMKVFTKDCVVSERAVNDNWNSVEIAVDKSEFIKMVKVAIRDGLFNGDI